MDVPSLPEDIFIWLGHVGVACYLTSYALLQAGILRGSGYAYTLLNLAAAALVLTSLTVAFNLSSALIQIFWITISIVGLTRMYLGNRRARFSDEESILLGRTFANSSKTTARRLFNSGRWITAEPGHRLTTQGKPVCALSYILAGQADVESGKRKIGELHSGFVGEMNVLHEGPATATVTVSDTARIFTISSDALKELCRKDPEFEILLERSLSQDTGRKLIAANVRLSDTGSQPWVQQH